MTALSSDAPALTPQFKLTGIGAVLVLATLAIGDNFQRYGGTPQDLNPELTAERQAAATRPSYIKSWVANNARAHDNDLQALMVAVGPKLDTRCTGANRSQLRRTLLAYLSERVAVAKRVKEEPALAGMDAAWRSADDVNALNDARNIIRNGYLLPSDLDGWKDEYNSIIALPAKVLTQCRNTIDEALAEEKEQRNLPRSSIKIEVHGR